MKGWNMIHKIKAMYDNGNGSSKRSIAKSLGISRNTVKKYLNASEEEIQVMLDNKERSKELDSYEDYIIFLLEKHPKLSTGKVLRKLEEKGYPAQVSDRTMRRYLNCIKERRPLKQKRYFEPILENSPGTQCQVDPGTMKNVIINGIACTVYFVVFVLSYSRYMYVSVSDKPVNTDTFIHMHNEAFVYFDGVCEECVYDQTKLVVINEEFREIKINEKFKHYAASAKFDVFACEGYDPESKGKVEAAVKYVKNNFFYGEEFFSFRDLKEKLSIWLEKTANSRVHGTTGKIPLKAYFYEEYKYMRPYHTPGFINKKDDLEIRKTDKTSLISYKSNKYSVPSLYQSSKVFIKATNEDLIIYSPDKKEEIARHSLSFEKGKILKNNNHYRDYTVSISDYEKTVNDLVGAENGSKICKSIKTQEPKIYRNQLSSLIKILNKHKSSQTFEKKIYKLSEKTSLNVSFIRDYLEAPEKQKNQVLLSLKKDNKKSALSRYDALTAAEDCEV